MLSKIKFRKAYFIGIAAIYSLLLYRIIVMDMQLYLLVVAAGLSIVGIGIKYPMIGLLFSFAAMNNFFDLIPRQLLSGTLINKTWDLGFILMIICSLPLLRKSHEKIDRIPLYIKIFSIFLIVCIISFLLTLIKYPFPFIDTIRPFRYYLGYLFLPIGFKILLQAGNGEKTFNLFLNILYGISFVLLILYIVQFLIQRPLFLGYVSTQTTSYGESFIRSLPNFLFICYFFLWFNLAALLLNRKGLPYAKLQIVLCYIATLFTFTRGLYLSITVISLISIFLIFLSIQASAKKILLLVFFVGIILLVFLNAGYLKPFIDRASTIKQATELSRQRDTLWYRFKLVEDRIKLIQAENPLLGLGFVHNKYGFKFGAFRGNFDEEIGGPALGCADIAWGNIIYQTGWAGFVSFSIFILAVGFYSCTTLRKRISAIHKIEKDNIFLFEFAAVIELLRMIFHTFNSAIFTSDTQNVALILLIGNYVYLLHKTGKKSKDENLNSDPFSQSRQIYRKNNKIRYRSKLA